MRIDKISRSKLAAGGRLTGPAQEQADWLARMRLAREKFLAGQTERARKIYLQARGLRAGFLEEFEIDKEALIAVAREEAEAFGQVDEVAQILAPVWQLADKNELVNLVEWLENRFGHSEIEAFGPIAKAVLHEQQAARLEDELVADLVTDLEKMAEPRLLAARVVMAGKETKLDYNREMLAEAVVSARATSEEFRLALEAGEEQHRAAWVEWVWERDDITDESAMIAKIKKSGLPKRSEEAKRLMKLAKQRAGELKQKPELELKTKIAALIGARQLTQALQLLFDRLAGREKLEKRDQLLVEALAETDLKAQLEVKLAQAEGALFTQQPISAEEERIWDLYVHLSRLFFPLLAQQLAKDIYDRPALAAAIEELKDFKPPLTQAHRPILQAIIKADPRYLFVYVKLVILMLGAGEYDEAQAVLDLAQKNQALITPGDKLKHKFYSSEVVFKQAQARTQEGKYLAASTLLGQAIRLAQEVIKSLTGRLKKELNRELQSQASLYLSSSLGMLACFQAIYHPGEVEKLGRPYYEKALQAAADDVTNLLLLAQNLSGIRAYDRHRAVYERILELEPDNVEGLVGLADIYIREASEEVNVVDQTRLAQAEGLLRRAVGLEPTHQAAVQYLQRLMALAKRA